MVVTDGGHAHDDDDSSLSDEGRDRGRRQTAESWTSRLALNSLSWLSSPD